LPVSEKDGRGLQGDDARDTARAISALTSGKVSHLSLTQDLYTVGVDVVQLTDKVSTGPGGANGELIEAPLRRTVAAQPI